MNQGRLESRPLAESLPHRVRQMREKQCWFRFYAELNDFLPATRRFRPVPFSFYTSPQVKDAIEGMGVPHTEVDLILANSESVDFSYLLRDGDRLSVYPVFESLDIKAVSRVRPEPLRTPRFVLDAHLGRLAAYLRMMGFDTLYQPDCRDEAVARVSHEQKRILLTRDRGLLKRGLITHGYYLREANPRRQLVEILRRFDLARKLAPFSRCLACNGLLEPASADTLAGRVPAALLARHNQFQRCPECEKVYWPGTHYERMRRLIAQVSAEVSDTANPK